MVPPSLSSYAKAEQLQSRLLEFGGRCCALFDGQYRSFERAHFAKQLVRSSTAPAANYAEARHAHSRLEFVQKMRYCLKELRESSVWLRLAAQRGLRPAESADLQRECSELIAIFVVSVKTASAKEGSG